MIERENMRGDYSVRSDKTGLINFERKKNKNGG